MTLRNWTPHALPSLAGKRILITGGNSGIGFETARILTRNGAGVTLLCRDSTRAANALAALQSEAADETRLDIISLDLSDLASVREASDKVKEKYPKVDAVINNAGIMAPPKRRTTKDGFELQFGVNHLGHFLLNARLNDTVQAACGRFVSVSSNMHKVGLRRIRFEDPHWNSGYKPTAAYSQSKLANALFAVELDRRLQAAGAEARAMVCHPGYAATNLPSNGPGPLLSALMIPGNVLVAQSAARGAWPTVLAAAEPKAKGGGYYGPKGFGELRGPVGEAQLSAQALDRDAAARLWALSEEAVGEAFPV